MKLAYEIKFNDFGSMFVVAGSLESAIKTFRDSYTEEDYKIKNVQYLSSYTAVLIQRDLI